MNFIYIITFWCSVGLQANIKDCVNLMARPLPQNPLMAIYVAVNMLFFLPGFDRAVPSCSAAWQHLDGLAQVPFPGFPGLVCKVALPPCIFLFCHIIPEIIICCYHYCLVLKDRWTDSWTLHQRLIFLQEKEGSIKACIESFCFLMFQILSWMLSCVE